MTFNVHQHLWLNLAGIASIGAVLSSFVIGGMEGSVYTVAYSAVGLLSLYAAYLRDSDRVSTEVPE